MTKQRSFDYSLGERSKLVIYFDYGRGSPGCHTLRNGDPGYPDEPEALEITDVQVWIRSASAAWMNTGASLPEEILSNDWAEAYCWEQIERTREDR